MSNYIEIFIEINQRQVSEILIAELSQQDFEGFEELESGIKAFIPEEKFDPNKLDEIVKSHKVTFLKSMIPQQNWNSLWESNFEPVIVEDFCEVRADFHKPSGQTKHEVIITPKMSFGTGHHATTYMMIEQMRNLDFTSKSVADFGTGTGILAVLAEKLGSIQILAIDNDDWSIENSKENIQRNNCNCISLLKSDAFSSKQNFDIILANINKNVILNNLDGLVFGTKEEGFLLVSGILKEDENDLVQALTNRHLIHVKTIERNNWISILFNKVVT